jgi:ADP-ribosyl-[dinitrogen reductase] hydrolase
MGSKKTGEPSVLDRMTGALIGFAVGDALGAPVEFMSDDEIVDKHGKIEGMIGGGWLDVIPGEVTDDTALTLATAEGIVMANDKSNPYEEIGDKFLRWFVSSPKDVGKTYSNVFREMIGKEQKDLGTWANVAKEVDRVLQKSLVSSNGGLMRAVYPALYYIGEDSEVVYNIISMTHAGKGNKEIIAEYCKVMSEIVINGGGKKSLEELWRVASVLIEIAAEWGNNWTVCGAAYRAAVCVQETTNFKSAVLKAVNHGGDTDTVAAITGSLAGALYGLSGIPDEWVEKLDNKRNNKLVKLFCTEEERREEVGLVERLKGLALLAYNNIRR